MSTLGGMVSVMSRWHVAGRYVSVMRWLQDASRQQSTTTTLNIMIMPNVRHNIEGVIVIN